ncbi:hypothetical protein AB0G02_30185 [Actinosynnema sp. NPDC023658]|uniref:hypothetical protein n=1 Tax=Actinosynnema sp. NPDC023658 TaxID=3155465 RepID=UPI0033FBFA45
MSRIGFVSAGVGIVIIAATLGVAAERVLRGPRRATAPSTGTTTGADRRRRAAIRAGRR